MIKHFLPLSCICILFVCCNNPSEAPKTPVTTAVVDDSHCFLYNDSSNIISLRVNYRNDSLFGALAYDIEGNEKEDKSGTVKGVWKGDLLVADYTFMSEGVWSVRQVIFKKSGTSLIGAVGEMEDKDGKMVFKNMDALNFNHSIVLHEVDCNKK